MKKLLHKLVHFFPSRLPIGLTEFNTWADDIIDTYGAPKNDTSKWALATAIMHLDASNAYKPKRYFGKVMIKGMCNQIVYAFMADVKAKQQADLEAANAAAAEASKSAEVPSAEQV